MKSADKFDMETANRQCIRNEWQRYDSSVAVRIL